MRLIIKIFAFSFIFFVFLSSVALADVWLAPPDNPPNSNRPAPIDQSGLSQTKSGALTVRGGLNVGNANQLQVDGNGNLTVPGLSVTGSPILDLGNALLFFDASSQSSFNINSNINRNQGLLSSVASILNINNQNAAHTLRLTNAGDGSSITLYASHSGSGWAGYFDGPVGSNAYIVVGGAVQGGYAGAGDGYFYDDVGLAGDLSVGGGVSTYDSTVADNTVETSQVCLGNGANCITQWSQAGSSLWTDAGTSIYASNVISPSEFRVYDAAYGGVKIRNNNLQLDNNTLIYQTADSGLSPVLVNDQLMIGRRYDIGCGHYCGGGNDPGVDLADNENLIFGRVRANPTGNANQTLLRLQQGNGDDATIDKFKVDLSGNTSVAGDFTVAGDAWNQGLTRTNYLWVLNGSPAGYDQIGDAYFAGDVYVGDTIKIAGGSPGAGKVLTSDANGLASWQSLASDLPAATSGQTLRYDGAAWIANSVIYNDGNNIGIGLTNPSTKLEVNGAISTAGATIGNNGNTILDGYLEVGGAYGSTGVTISNAGNISANGNLIVDGTVTNPNNFYINGDGNVQIRVDANNNGSHSFALNNGFNNTVFQIDEAGLVSVNGGIAIDDDGGITAVNAGDLTLWSGTFKVCSGDSCDNDQASNDGELYVELDAEFDSGICLEGATTCSDPSDGDLEVEDGSVCIGNAGCTPPASDGSLLIETKLENDNYHSIGGANPAIQFSNGNVIIRLGQ